MERSFVIVDQQFTAVSAPGPREGFVNTPACTERNWKRSQPWANVEKMDEQHDHGKHRRRLHLIIYVKTSSLEASGPLSFCISQTCPAILRPRRCWVKERSAEELVITQLTKHSSKFINQCLKPKAQILQGRCQTKGQRAWVLALSGLTSHAQLWKSPFPSSDLIVFIC